MNQQLKVGIGKEVILLPDSLFPIETFTDIHDELHVRVLYIQSNESVVIVSLELTSLKDYEIVKLKELISKNCDVSIDNIWITTTHTFNAPHVRSKSALKNEELKTKNELLCNAIEDATYKAVLQAIKTAKEVQVGYNTNEAHFNVNRDISTDNGYWLGKNPNGYSSNQLKSVCFKTLDGKVLAILYNYDIQSSVMKDSTCSVSADLSGATSSFIEEQYDDEMIAMFLIGAAGDQSPVFTAIDDKLGSDGFLQMNRLAQQFGNEVVQSVNKIVKLENAVDFVIDFVECDLKGQRMPEKLSDIKPSKYYLYMEGGNHKLRSDVIILGDIALIGVKPELTSIIGDEIRKHSPFTNTLVVTMVNGGAKYMAEKSAYERNTYAAMNSMFAKGSAEMLCNCIIDKLKRIKKK
ncbi:hypothetical protein [Breznakia pachnodae]|uniref:Neutral/alkaline non-lysosomal ceramidase N-terminal domain-containing protein n=1 Tax=Breznakia pachnodae TaxID=265178 RepID=A0ABU0E512_9FIRM|nr:hypothetical protein [Breznakia pachnodae]MDQ0361997.1 hypothetical protein [Breznakia pachnodae]